MQLRETPPKTIAKRKKHASISKKFKKNSETILKLLNENIDLRYKNNLLYADKIVDEEIDVGTKKKPEFKKVKKMIWKEEFVDKDTNESVLIDRISIIEIEGEKSDGWRLIQYYTKDDF